MQLGTELDGTSPPFHACHCRDFAWRRLRPSVCLSHLRIINAAAASGPTLLRHRHPQVAARRKKKLIHGELRRVRPHIPQQGRRCQKAHEAPRVEVLQVTSHPLMWDSSPPLRRQGEKQAICPPNKVKGGTESCESLSWKQKYYSRRREFNHLQEHLAIYTL